ncbi:hypothetical protein BJY04DRAFT_185526 [Aspergillus karnatakaensis]|uniref:uncharacterized protein n=1 Tax=Aspergillus karnatakaensis TaxID=1810916 RepID=UPI003CCCBEFA
MKASLALLPLLSALTTSVLAFELKVNYYSDGGCDNYLTSIWPYDNDECYDYDYSGTNSALIADCKGYLGCTCTFYQEKGCQGTQSQFGTACKSNWGGGWKSMKCTGFF